MQSCLSDMVMAFLVVLYREIDCEMHSAKSDIRRLRKANDLKAWAAL